MARTRMLMRDRAKPAQRGELVSWVYVYVNGSEAADRVY